MKNKKAHREEQEINPLHTTSVYLLKGNQLMGKEIKLDENPYRVTHLSLEQAPRYHEVWVESGNNSFSCLHQSQENITRTLDLFFLYNGEKPFFKFQKS